MIFNGVIEKPTLELYKIIKFLYVYFNFFNYWRFQISFQFSLAFIISVDMVTAIKMYNLLIYLYILYFCTDERMDEPRINLKQARKIVFMNHSKSHYYYVCL